MPIDNTKLKQLYDTLKQGGYKKDYNNFRTKFLGNENYPYRQKVFNLLSENGEDYGSTYGEFMQRMQVAKPTAASAAPKQPQQIDTLSTIQSARDTIFNPNAAVQPGGNVGVHAGKTAQTQDDAATKPFDVNQANAFVENMRLQNEVAQRQHQNVNDYLQHTAGQFGKNATQLGFNGKSNLGLPLAPKNQDGAFIDALGREYESETEARLAQMGAQHAREALTEANMQHNDPKNYLLEQKARIEKELNARSSQLEGATDRVPSFATGVAGNAMTQAAARLTDKLQDTKYKALTMQLDKVNQALDTLDEAEHAKASDQWIADSSNWAERAGKGVLSFGAATGRSFKRQASKLSNWDFGFSDLAGGLAIYDAVDKADKGGVEALSPEQRKMLDLYAYNNHIQGENKEHLGWGNTAGTVTAQALPFMLEMALNPASGVGKFAQRKAMQWAVKKYGKEKLKQIAKRYLLAKAGTRIAGDWLGAATMSATTGQARVAADAVQRRIGEVETDIDNFGRVTYGGHKNGVDWGEAFGKAFLSNTIENQTEMAGDYFGIIGKAFSKGGQKALDKIGLGFVNDFMRNVSSTKVAKAVTDFENATHWNGTTGEYLEEVLGNVENALMVGDSTFDTDKDTGVFNVDKNIETFLSVAVMGGFFSAVKTASYTAPKKRALNEMADIGRQIDGMLGNNNAALEQWGTWRNTFINGTDEEKKQTLREVMDNQQLPMGFRMAFLEYTKAAQKYHGIAQAEQKRAEEGTLDPIGQALDQAYEEGYGTTEPTERQMAYRRLNETRAKVAQLLELEEGEDLDEAMGNDPIGYIHTLEEQGFTPEQIQPVMDYANAQVTYEGVMQQREDSANEQADAVKREVRQITHRQTGQIQKATLDGGEREVYVLNGKVVLYPDGTGVDKQESDDVLYVQDVQTGELFTIAPNRISELAEATDPQAVIAEREEEIAAAMNQEFAQEEGAEGGTAAPTEAPEVRIPAPRFSGARVTLDLPNGSSVNGVVLQETDDGVEVQTDSPVNGRFVQVFPTDEFDGMLSSVRDEADEVIWSREGAGPVDVEEENQNDAAANGQQREMKGNGIPVDAKTGEPVYDAVAPDVAWDAIVQEAEGDEAMAMQVVTDIVADMEAKVQKAKKAKVRAGSTVRERLEAQKKHKRRIEEAEAQLEAWRRIAAVKAERIAAAERAKIEAAQQREVTQDDETEVPDFVFDKPENARERGYRMQNGQRADRQEPIAAVVGKEVSVKFTNKVSQPVRVAVVDARSLQPSHQNGQSNVLHFLPEAQPKKRTDHESVHAAEQMAAQMNPEEITSSVTAYTGAPSVNARGEVIQGNNRTAALKRMWQGYPEQAAAYKQYLMNHASEYGLNPEDIAAMEQPVLVNLMDVTDEQAIELGQYDVKDTESGGTERIKPRNVSQKMGDKAERFASILLRTTDEDASVSQLIDEHAVETLKWLEAQHYISPTQYRSAFNADGQVTPEAKNDLRGILYQAVFKNGSERLEDMFNALPAKAQRAILATAYRDFATPESEKMLPEIQNSIVAFYELSQDAAFANAKNFEEARKATMAWLQQMQFDFSTGQSVSREGKYTNFALTLAAMYKVQTQTAIQQTFNDMFDLLQGRQQPDLYNPNPNNTPRTLAEAIREVLNIEYDGTNGSHALGGNNETRQSGRQGSARDDSAGGTDAPGNAAADAEGGTGRDKGRVGTENEGRGNKEKENDETEVIGSSMTADEALDFIADMELGAEIAPEIDLTIENWDSLFGKEGIVSTPIGNVKMGENQFTKLMRQGRNGKLGMIKPTLEHPHAIIADVSEAKEGDITERASSYVFIRSFKKVDGSRYYYFTSITVSKDGKEVVISNQEKRRNAIANLLTKGKLVWKHADDVSDASDMAQGLYSSQGNVSDLATEGTDAPQTTISSTGKDTPENRAVQTSGQENAETSLQSEVTRAEQQTNAEPTEGQKEAGNYKKGRVKVGPFDVVIEQPRGSVRSGVDANGKAWETTMQNTYGYFGGTKGVDGDAIDVFLGNDLDEWDGTTVFVVDQYNPDGSFDEHKVMLGFNSQEEAEAAYFANYEADWAKTHRTEVTAVPLADFNEWVKSSKRKTKAFAEYKVARRNAEIDAHNAQNEQLAEQLFSMAKEAETEKDFFDRAASLFEVTGYESDLRDIYNGVKSGEIANARALSFYTNATLKPIKEGVKGKSKQTETSENEHESKEKAPKPRQHKSTHEAQPTTAETTLRDALVDVAQQSGLEVVVDEKAQQVLDEVNGRARTMAFGEEYDYDRYPEGRVEPNIADKYVHIERAKLDHGFANFNEAKEWAKSHIVRTLDNAESGGKGNVKISSTAVNKYLSESAVAKSDSKDVHLAVLKKLPEIIHDSVDVETTPDFKKDENGVRKVGNEINKNVLIHRCYGAVEINGNIYRVKITLKEYKDAVRDNKAYSYEATKIELLAGTLVGRDISSNPGTNNSISVAKLLKDVEMSYRPGVKVLEESAKQRARLREHRVFHGSGAEFSAFDHSHMGEGEGSQSFGWGTYVTSSSAIGKSYAKRSATGIGLKRSELESNISRAKEQLPFVRGEVKEDLEAKIGDWENQLENLDESRHLYTVEIPEDTGNNYLDWYSTLSKEQKDTITKALTRLHVDLTDYERRGFSLDDTIGDIYHFLTIALRHTRKWQDVNASRASSKFLSSLGFTGIKYPAGTIHGGAEKGDMNYVIFNEKDAQITDHIRFFRTPGGEAYGFTVDGKIYLDPRIATAETPIHEYAHLWADMIRNVNAEAWNDIVGLMKSTPIWEEVRGLYPELKTDDEIADEVLAHYSGRRGAERLREAQQQAATETGKSVFERAAAVAAIERVKQALAKFWQSVAELFHIRFTSAEEVADRVLADMLNGVNPNQYIKRKGRGVQKLHLNDKTLAGIHNITEEKLRKALNLGGLANPSLAIIDTAQNKHEDFGEISLIAPSALVDKETGQTAGTWTTDAYTQRYPQVERVMSDVGFKKFNKWVESLDLLDSEKSEIKWQTKEAFESNRELSWELIYLLEKGIDAHAYTSNAPYEWKQTLDAYSSADELLDGMQKDEELHKKVVNYVKGELSKPIKEKIRGQIRQQIKNETGIAPAILPPRYRKQVTEIFNRDYAKDLFGEDLMPGEEDVKKVMQHLFDLHNRTKHVDFSLSKSKASTYVHSHDLYSDYLRWQNKKLKEFGVKGRLFRGYSADGSRKYIPETLKNVSKAMVADANGQTNGGEMVSLGSFVAKFADRVDSADEMRANKKRLATNESKQGFYSEWMPTYKELADELSDDIFAGEQRLHDIAVQDNPVKYAKKEYGITLSKSFMDKLNAFKKAIREDMTSAYFETKFERPVYLNEFAAAVIPSDLSEDVKGGLEKSGIAIYEYDPKIEGDRDRATNAAFEADNRIRFQFVGEKGAAALDKAEEATTRLDNLGVAREMESQEKDAKAIKLATGWERGGDGKWRYEIVDGELKKEPNVKEKVSSDGEVHYETTLGEILDNEELYRSYPELRMLPVSIQQMDGGVSGIYLPSGYMSLSMGLYRHRTQPGDVRREIEQIESTPEYKEYSKYFEGDMPDAYIGREDEWEEAMNEAEAKFFESELGKRYHDLMWGDKRKAYSYGFDEVGKGVILHEVQHAIQHIEGFAMGGNSTTYREHLAGFREKYEAWSVIDEFEDKSKELGDDARPIDVYNALVREYQSLGLEFGDGFAPSREAFDKGFNLWTRGYDNEGYEDAYNEYQRLMGKFGSGEYNNRYDQLAGEVEARNVQKRLHMTAEERRQSLAEETEDVAREDQIFIMDGIESANSLGDSASFDEHQNEDLKAVNERFNEQLGILTEKNADSMVFSLGRPSVVLQSAGVMNKPMKLYGNKVMKKMRKHGFALEELRDLPRAVADPIAVFNNYGEDGNRSILTELRTQQGNFLVTLSTGVDQDVDFNIVRSVFGKGDENVLDWINKGLATYINKEKALSFLSYQSAPIAATAANAGQSSKGLSSASQPVQQEIDKLDTATKVVKDFVNPQLSEENNFREGKGELSDDMLSYLNDPMAQMMGKPRGTKKQRAQFAERERGRMQAHAEKLVERLHLSNVEIVTDASQLEGKQRTAKGFYNKRTGKITIVLPNHASTADVEQTLLHEAVAHYGLRQLFGEHFDDFLDMVYRNAEEGIRRKIAEASAKHGWNVRTATEEYLADLAERTDFENTSPTWWAKIKDFFLNMLRGLGFEAMDGQTLTDNELRYVLWRSYENLTEPGKYPTFIAEARDVAKQHALQVGRFAPTETVGSRVAENEALSEEEMSEILFRDGSTYNYTQVLARDRYERRIKSGMYQTQEALQDSMLGLRTAMESILEAEGRKGVYIEDIDGFENAYLGENRLSSVNQAEAEKFAREVFAPMLEEVSKLAPTAEERAKLIDYLFAKHGLERNEVMARRAAAKEARKEFEKELRTAERAVAKDPLDLDAEDALDDVKQRMQEREDALYSKNRQTDYAGLTTLTGKAAVADAERMARDMVAAYENAHDTKALWDAINNVTQRTLKKSFDTGMISRDTYDDIRSMYQFYIPLRGFDERTSNEAYSYLGGTESVFTSPIKTAKGRRSKADDPLAYMQMMAESAIAQGNRNQLVKQKLLNFALNHPSDLISVSELWLRRDPITDQWNVVQPGDLPGTDKLEDSDTAEMVSQKMEQFEQAMKQFAAQNPTDFVRQCDRPDIPYRVVNAREMQQHQVMVKRNGKTYVLTINGNPRAAQAVNGLTNPNNDMSGAIGVMARSVESANRWLSSVYTTRNPDFVLTNLARDAGYTNTMVWLKEDSSYAVNFNRNYATRANLVNMIRLYSRLMKGQLDLTDPTEMLFSQFISNGGETGYTAMRDLDAHKTKIKKELKKLSSDPSVRKVWNASFDMLDLFNKAAENSARFAAFITSREAGRTLDRSIYDAKEISVNFNKKGAGAKFLDNYGAQVKNDIRDLSWKNPNLLKLTKDVAIYLTVFSSGVGRSFFAFWNAAIQGSTNFGRVVKRHPKKALTAMAIMFALGLANAMVGASGDDDDDAEEGNGYFDHPSNTRRSNLMLRINGKSWASIPLPVEYRAVYGMGELLGSVMSGKERYTNQELAHEVLCQVSQVLPLDVVGEGSGAFVPTAVKPLYEVVTNESWTGLPIYKQTAYNERDPAYTKAYSNTNKQLVGMSKMLNELSGGDSQKSGWIDVNPAVVEHLGRGYLGGYFNLVDKLVKTGETVVGSREYDPSNLLIVNRFVKSGSERTAYRAINNRYYQIKADSEELIKDYKGYNYETKTGKRDYSQKIAQMNGSPELLSAMAAHEYITEVDKYNKALKSEQDEVLKKRMEKELYELKSAMIHTVDSILDHKQTLRKAE